MNIIDGKAISAKCKAETAEEIKALTANGLRAPCLAVILVGDDPASAVYVRNKKRACEAVGITSLEYLLSADETEEKLMLRSTIITAAYKIYLDCCFDVIREDHDFDE